METTYCDSIQAVAGQCWLRRIWIQTTAERLDQALSLPCHRRQIFSAACTVRLAVADRRRQIELAMLNHLISMT